MKEKYDIAVVGATGLVGETMIEILEQRDFPVGDLYALASERSVGKSAQFRGRNIKVGNLAEFDFSAADIAQTIEEAKELSAEELANLEPYADRVSAFDELPRVGDLELSGSNTSQSSAMEAYFIDNPDGIKAFIEVRDALSEMLDGPGKSGSFVNDSIRPSEQIAGIGSMFLEGNTTSEYEYPFGQFLVTTYEKLHDDVMKTNPEEARQLLFPDSEDSMKSYVERISFMLMKTRITPESFKDAMDKVESEGILDFLKDQKLIEYEDVEQKLAA